MPSARAPQRQRVEDVVALADEGDGQPLKVAEALPQRQQVGQRLARMLEVAQGVDHRHGHRLGQLIHGGLGEGPCHERVHPAVERARDVVGALAATQAHIRVGQVDRAAAKLLRGQLEGDARPQAGFLEEQDHRPSSQWLFAVGPGERPFGLQGGRRLEQARQLERRQVADAEQVATAEVGPSRGRRCGPGGWRAHATVAAPSTTVVGRSASSGSVHAQAAPWCLPTAPWRAASVRSGSPKISMKPTAAAWSKASPVVVRGEALVVERERASGGRRRRRCRGPGAGARRRDTTRWLTTAT